MKAKLLCLAFQKRTISASSCLEQIRAGRLGNTSALHCVELAFTVDEAASSLGSSRGCCKTKVRSFVESACHTVLKLPASAHSSQLWLTLDRCFIEKAKLLCFCLPKEDTTRNHVYDGFYVYVSLLRPDKASQYVKRHNIYVTCLRHSANHNTLDSWPIRAHLAFQTDELCKNRRVSEGET